MIINILGAGLSEDARRVWDVGKIIYPFSNEPKVL